MATPGPRGRRRRPGVARRARGRPPSPPRPTGRSSCAASPSTRRSAGSRSPRCCFGCGAVTPPPTPRPTLMGACLVAAIDHGPLAPSALVARTIASTRATPMSALAGGILSFGELHGAVVTRAMRIVATVPADGEPRGVGRQVFEQRARGRPPAARRSGIAGTSTISAPSGCWTSRPRHSRRPARGGCPGARCPGGRARRPSRRRQHRRGARRRPHRPATRPRVRRLPVRDRQELRPRCAHRGGARAGAADAHDRPDRRALRRRSRFRQHAAQETDP